MEWITVDIDLNKKLQCAKCGISLVSIINIMAYTRATNANNELICSLIFDANKIDKSLIQ